HPAIYLAVEVQVEGLALHPVTRLHRRDVRYSVTIGIETLSAGRFYIALLVHDFRRPLRCRSIRGVELARGRCRAPHEQPGSANDNAVLRHPFAFGSPADLLAYCCRSLAQSSCVRAYRC